MAMLRAGAAEADMTPPVGIRMAGDWRPRQAEAIETPLAAHALVLDDGRTRAAVVTLDLIAIAAEDADEAKRQIEAETGIPPQNVLVACSHTHEAPYPTPLLGTDTGPDPAFMARVRDAVAGSVAAAAERLEPAEFGFGSTRAAGLGENRRRVTASGDGFNVWMLTADQRAECPPAGPVDDEVTLAAVRATSGEPIALLWGYALHAHAFWARSICADYPYYTAQEVRRRLGAEPACLFTAGACGDINRPGSVGGDQIVDRLARALQRLYAELEFTDEADVGVEFRPFETRLRDFSTFQEDEIRRKLPEALEVARGEWELLRDHSGERLTTSLHALRIGEFAVAGVPGEYFCALGMDVKERSPFTRTAVAELVDDYVGYIPTAEAYDQGGYELFNMRSSKVARGTGERMADELVRMLHGLHER